MSIDTRPARLATMPISELLKQVKETSTNEALDAMATTPAHQRSALQLKTLTLESYRTHLDTILTTLKGENDA